MKRGLLFLNREKGFKMTVICICLNVSSVMVFKLMSKFREFMGVFQERYSGNQSAAKMCEW